MTFRRLVSFGEETTYGTPPANVTGWIGLVQTFNGGVEQASEYVAALDAERKKRPMIHGLDVSPSFEYYVQNARFFKYAFGSVTNTGTGPYTHTITISPDYALPSVTLLEHRLGTPVHGYQYAGCRVETLELSWDVDGFLTASINCIAKSAQKVTTLPNITPDGAEPFKASQKTVTINGVQNDYVVSGSVSITNNHAKYPRSGDWIVGTTAGRVDFDATLDVYYIDASLMDLMLNKTVFDVIIKFTRSANDYVEILLDDCVVTTEAELPAEGELMQTLNLKPSDVRITAVDNIPSY
ncbi:MAG: phage tail tube protein [Candidatus Caldarchaeum sp.]